MFGEIKNGEMVLNEGGRMVAAYWTDLEKRFTGVEIDEFVVMPNHFHGIVVLVGADRCVCPGGVEGQGEHEIKQGEHIGSPLPKIIQWFKTMTTNEYLRKIRQHNWPPFPGRLWQRNYYEPWPWPEAPARAGT